MVEVRRVAKRSRTLVLASEVRIRLVIFLGFEYLQTITSSEF